MLVFKRSFLANNKNNLLLMDRGQNRSLWKDVLFQDQRGFVQKYPGCRFVRRPRSFIRTSPVVSYNPNLIAFSTTGCKIKAGSLNCSASSGTTISVCKPVAESHFFDLKIQLQILNFFFKRYPLLFVFFECTTQKIT